MDKAPCPEMLAFPYQINKIIRDMKNLSLPSEDAEHKRDAVIAMLAEVCGRINDEFGAD